MFIRIDGEDLAKNIFRRAQIYINSEGGEKKIKGVIENWVIIYLREIFNRKIQIAFF